MSKGGVKDGGWRKNCSLELGLSAHQGATPRFYEGELLVAIVINSFKLLLCRYFRI